MRVAIARCAGIDEVAGIKDRAAQLEAYARVRDDVEAQRQFAEIRLRACMRIGQLSRELPKGKPGPKPGQGKLGDTDVAQFDKENVLERTGINIRSAERYEELTGGREEQAQNVAINAAEVYLAKQEETGEMPTMRGLRGAVRQAVHETFGTPPEKPKPAPPEPKPPDTLAIVMYPIYSLRDGDHNFDPVFLAEQQMEELAREDVEACENFIRLLEAFIIEVKKRFPHEFRDHPGTTRESIHNSQY
jgi:hypothetical protein